MDVESSFQKLSLEEKSSLNGNNMGYKFLPEFGCRRKSASTILARREVEMARKLREQQQLQEECDEDEEECDEDDEESDEDEEENGESEEFTFEKALALRRQMLERRAEKMRWTNSEMIAEAEEFMRENLD